MQAVVAAMLIDASNIACELPLWPREVIEWQVFADACTPDVLNIESKNGGFDVRR